MSGASVVLTDAELALLDGQCSAKVQEAVDAAKARLAAVSQYGSDLSPALAGFIADVRREAQVRGRLGFQWTNVRRCPVCGRDEGYWPHKRTTARHRKGEPNYDKPKLISAVELAVRFVRFQHSLTVGCCDTCWNVVQPVLATALDDVRAAISERVTGRPPRFRWARNHACGDCGWQGHEGEMGTLPAIMGGYYPGECPQCGAKNLPFGRTVVKAVDGFALVPIEAATPAGVP